MKVRPIEEHIKVGEHVQLSDDEKSIYEVVSVSDNETLSRLREHMITNGWDGKSYYLRRILVGKQRARREVLAYRDAATGQLSMVR